MAKCQHDWKPAFTAPTAQNSPETRVDFLLMDRTAQDARVCATCGAVGTQSRGSRRGGGHKVFCLSADNDQVPVLIERAQAWNCRVRNENTPQTVLAK